MKVAAFLRHGHAENGPDDHARELTDEGRLAIQAAASQLAALDVRPQVILCSSARRARATAELAAQALGGGGVEEQRALYLADPDAILRALRALEDETSVALLVGHNPGLEDLASRFGEGVRLAPAAYFVLRRDVLHWQEFAP